MKLVKFSILAVLGLLAFALLCGLFMPRAWQVERSRLVRAEPGRVHAVLEDVQRWPEWYPYNREKDATIQFTYAGAARGVGAVLSWTSERVGAASLTLTKSDPQTGVAYDLVFPGFDRPSHGSIALAREGAATRVTWRDGGELGVNPIPRLFRGMIERMLAQDFDDGLLKLATMVEATPR